MAQLNIDQAMQLAAQHFSAGHVAAAQDMYRKIILAAPTYAPALHGLAMSAAKTGRLDMALLWMDRAIAAAPQVAEFHCDLGSILARSGMLTQAVDSYQKALQLKADFPEAKSALKRALAEKSQLDSAPFAFGRLEPRLQGEEHRYVIVTGYYNKGGSEAEDFFRLWYDNTMKHAKPQRIYVVNAASKPVKYGDCQWINLSKNLHHHIAPDMPLGQQLGGSSIVLLMGCLLAYHERADLLFKEQDCLAFGDYVATLYDDLSDKGIVFGQINTSGDAAGILAQSLVLAKLDYLIEFLVRYASLWPSDREFLPEQKFLEIAKTGRAAQTRMGYDRSRPVNYADKSFYMQKITQDEMQQLKMAGLI